MEDTLRAVKNLKVKGVNSLNPCFNGRYSQSFGKVNYADRRCVLILVLMEDTLREYY